MCLVQHFLGDTSMVARHRNRDNQQACTVPGCNVTDQHPHFCWKQNGDVWRQNFAQIWGEVVQKLILHCSSSTAPQGWQFCTLFRCTLLDYIVWYCLVLYGIVCWACVALIWLAPVNNPKIVIKSNERTRTTRPKEVNSTARKAVVIAAYEKLAEYKRERERVCEE